MCYIPTWSLDDDLMVACDPKREKENGEKGPLFVSSFMSLCGNDDNVDNNKNITIK